MSLEDIQRFVEEERGTTPKQLIDQMVEAANTGGDEEKAKQWGTLMGFLIAMDIKSGFYYWEYDQNVGPEVDVAGDNYYEAKRDAADDIDWAIVDYVKDYLGEE